MVIGDISLICSISCEASFILLVFQSLNYVQKHGFSSRVEAEENSYISHSQQIKRIKQMVIGDISLICSISCEASFILLVFQSLNYVRKCGFSSRVEAEENSYISHSQQIKRNKQMAIGDISLICPLHRGFPLTSKARPLIIQLPFFGCRSNL
jgi:hypothetical protein